MSENPNDPDVLLGGMANHVGSAPSTSHSAALNFGSRSCNLTNCNGNCGICSPLPTRDAADRMTDLPERMDSDEANPQPGLFAAKYVRMLWAKIDRQEAELARLSAALEREEIEISRRACNRMIGSVREAGGDNEEYHVEKMKSDRDHFYPFASPGAPEEGEK